MVLVLVIFGCRWLSHSWLVDWTTYRISRTPVVMTQGWVFWWEAKPTAPFLPLDSRNQESAQIPGFWSPMVKKVQWDFSLIINRAPRVQVPCLQISTDQPENKSSHLRQSELVSWCTWPGVKSIARWTQSPVPCGTRFMIRGICTDSWFLESNGKKSAVGFFSDHKSIPTRDWTFVTRNLRRFLVSGIQW
jgi:hypothetical protein